MMLTKQQRIWFKAYCAALSAIAGGVSDHEVDGQVASDSADEALARFEAKFGATSNA